MEPGMRLSFIRSRIDVGARRSTAWSAVWGSTFGALGITQLAIVPSVDKNTRVVLYVGAASAGIGVLTRAILIPRVILERRRLRRMSTRLSGCELLHAAERSMVASAKSERRGRHILLHLTALGYNVGLGLLLGLGFDQPVSGNRVAAMGATIGQVMLVTQPTTMVEALEHYQKGELRPSKWSWSTQPLVIPGGAGLAIGGRI
jgi:hypothetical protein